MSTCYMMTTCLFTNSQSDLKVVVGLAKIRRETGGLGNSLKTIAWGDTHLKMKDNAFLCQNIQIQTFCRTHKIFVENLKNKLKF